MARARNNLCHHGALQISSVVALLLLAAAAVSADDCLPKVTFFPPGSEDRNFPTAWGRTVQLAAGNMNTNIMYSVVMPSLSIVPGTRQLGYPTLQVYPMHDVLQINHRNISEKCLGFDSGTSFPGPEKAEELSVTKPPRYRIEYDFNGTGTIVAGEYQETMGRTIIPRIVLDQLATYPDAYYCLTVTVVIISWSGQMQHVAVPAKDLVASQQVCFYKLDTQTKGQVNFTTCGKDFEVSISHVEPPPIPLYPGSNLPLFNPVIHMRSDLNRTPDFNWPENGARTKFEHWRLLTDAKKYSFVPEIQEGEGEGELTEGWWNVKLEVSLLSSFPTLIVPNLMASVSTYNDTSAPEALKDQLKFLAAEQYPPGTVMGIQHAPTRFMYMEGPSSDSEILPNQEVPFTWEFKGFGNQTCYVDGQLVENAAEHTCLSPINVRVPNRKNHTFTVELEDVCGNNFSVAAAYSTWGSAVTKAPNNSAIADDGTECASGPDGCATGEGVFEMAPMHEMPATLRLGGSGARRGRKIGSGSTAPACSTLQVMTLGALVGVVLML